MSKLPVTYDEKGPITLLNYGKRAELHASRRLKSGADNDFPIAHKKTEEGRKLLTLWEAYFRVHLGGYPLSFRRLLRDDVEGFTVPDARPEVFDISWEPRGFNPSIAGQ
jgi:hypothetical protein